MNFKLSQIRTANDYTEIRTIVIICCCGLLMIAFAGLPIAEAFTGQPEQLFKAHDVINKTELLHQLPTHVVQPGETLFSISRYYFVDVTQLMSLNGINNPTTVPVGCKLYIPPINIRLARLRRYQVSDSTTVIRLRGQFNLDTYQFTRLNPTIKSDALPSGTVLWMPKKAMVVANRGGYSRLLNPVRGCLTSKFGWRWGRMHSGVDLAAATGTPVRAVANGTVVTAGWCGGYGLLIKIKHGNYYSLYGHLSQILVHSGENVYPGGTIGLVGATGHAYGSHLHFELEKSGYKINPLPYISD